MRHAGFLLSLALAVVWLGSGLGLAGLPRAADDSAVQPVGPGQVPAALNPVEWQRIEGQLAKLIAADGATGDYFGYSVSASGDTAVVGARDAHVGSNADQGAAYVFSRDLGGADAWGQAAKLTATDGAAEDRFGVSVSISGDTTVVGAIANVGPNVDQGTAYVYLLTQHRVYLPRINRNYAP
jgi:FG-GAP repeat